MRAKGEARRTATFAWRVAQRQTSTAREVRLPALGMARPLKRIEEDRPRVWLRGDCDVHNDSMLFCNSFL